MQFAMSIWILALKLDESTTLVIMLWVEFATNVLILFAALTLSANLIDSACALRIRETVALKFDCMVNDSFTKSFVAKEIGI